MNRKVKSGGTAPSDIADGTTSSAVADAVPPASVVPVAPKVFRPPTDRLSELAEGVEAESEVGTAALGQGRQSDPSTEVGDPAIGPERPLLGPPLRPVGRLAPVSPAPDLR